MKTVTATEIKTKFGQYLEYAQKEPLTIEKSGRDVAVMISVREYEMLKALEDAHWADLAQQAIKEGFVSNEEAMAIIQERLNAET